MTTEVNGKRPFSFTSYQGYMLSAWLITVDINLDHLDEVVFVRFLHYKVTLFIYLFIYWPHLVACGILVPWPRIEPVPPALEVWSLNHWTAREVPEVTLYPPSPLSIWCSLEGNHNINYLISLLIINRLFFSFFLTRIVEGSRPVLQNVSPSELSGCLFMVSFRLFL